MYLIEIGRIPLLDSDAEIELSKAIAIGNSAKQEKEEIDKTSKDNISLEYYKELEEKYNTFLNENEEDDIRKERKCSSYIQYVNKIFERRDGGNIPLAPPMKKPDIKYNVSLSDNEKDVNAIFIIESAIPLSRKRPLLSHYDTNYKGNDIFLICKGFVVFFANNPKNRKREVQNLN